MAAEPAAGRRTQAERRSESEEALLAAAAELVAERGIERSSLASIGERAGTSRGLPTHHFGSKDALVERLASRAQDRIQEALRTGARELGPKAEEMTALDSICLVVDIYLGVFEDPSAEERALLVLWGSTFPSHASVKRMHEADARSYEGIADLVIDGQRDGSVRSDLDPTAAAVLVLGVMRGVSALLITDQTVTDMRRVRADCQTFMRNALGRRTNGDRDEERDGSPADR